MTVAGTSGMLVVCRRARFEGGAGRLVTTDACKDNARILPWDANPCRTTRSTNPTDPRPSCIVPSPAPSSIMLTVACFCAGVRCGCTNHISVSNPADHSCKAGRWGGNNGAVKAGPDVICTVSRGMEYSCVLNLETPYDVNTATSDAASCRPTSVGDGDVGRLTVRDGQSSVPPRTVPDVSKILTWKRGLTFNEKAGSSRLLDSIWLDTSASGDGAGPRKPDGPPISYSSASRAATEDSTLTPYAAWFLILDRW